MSALSGDPALGTLSEAEVFRVAVEAPPTHTESSRIFLSLNL